MDRSAEDLDFSAGGGSRQMCGVVASANDTHCLGMIIGTAPPGAERDVPLPASDCSRALMILYRA